MYSCNQKASSVVVISMPFLLKYGCDKFSTLESCHKAGDQCDRVWAHGLVTIATLRYHHCKFVGGSGQDDDTPNYSLLRPRQRDPRSPSGSPQTALLVRWESGRVRKEMGEERAGISGRVVGCWRDSVVSPREICSYFLHAPLPSDATHGLLNPAVRFGRKAGREQLLGSMARVRATRDKGQGEFTYEHRPRMRLATSRTIRACDNAAVAVQAVGSASNRLARYISVYSCLVPTLALRIISPNACDALARADQRHNSRSTDSRLARGRCPPLRSQPRYAAPPNPEA